MLRLIALLTILLPLQIASAQLAQNTPSGVEAPAMSAPTETPARPTPEASAPKAPKAELFYVINRQTMVYRDADSTRPYVTLSFREPVEVVGKEGRWSEIRTKDGARGFVPSSYLSNTWFRVSKSEKTLYVYRGAELVDEVPIDLGYNTFADKERRGNPRDKDHWRTPEGTFFVVGKNPNSSFYKAFVLNYPNAEDAEQGLRKNLITEKEYAAIIQAEREFKTPPMGTALGGMIEIHGNGTGKRGNWTQGCVAITDAQMDRLWNMVEVGTPVLIEQ